MVTKLVSMLVTMSTAASLYGAPAKNAPVLGGIGLGKVLSEGAIVPKTEFSGGQVYVQIPVQVQIGGCSGFAGVEVSKNADGDVVYVAKSSSPALPQMCPQFIMMQQENFLLRLQPGQTEQGVIIGGAKYSVTVDVQANKVMIEKE